MKKIAIIGAGNIGRRYLESFSLTSNLYEIYMVDVSQDALNLAEHMTNCLSMEQTVFYLNKVEDLPREIDLAAITTTSRMRREVVKNLLNHSKVNNIILEKFLFDKLEDYDIVAGLLKRNNINAWVNCTRRAQKGFIWLKEELKKDDYWNISVSGGDWGLGCNVVHYLDIIACLSGIDNACLSLDGLEDIIGESKRKSYKEIYGTISGRMGKCKNFSISSYRNSTRPMFFTISTNRMYYQINEKEQYITCISENGECFKREFPSLYTSQIMESIIREILETGRCLLASYQESREIHELIQVPLTKFFESNGFENGSCPIT